MGNKTYKKWSSTQDKFGKQILKYNFLKDNLKKTNFERQPLKDKLWNTTFKIPTSA